MRIFFTPIYFFLLTTSILLAFPSSGLAAGDGFEGLKCGADLSQALRGRQISNEPVVGLEARHRDLGLQALGASEISEKLSSVAWLICRTEYLLLEDARGLVHDVLPFPTHSKTYPVFSGPCQYKGKMQPEILVGILDNSGPEKMDLLPPKTAWSIDEKAAKFIKKPPESLQCPRSEIYTEDGGL